MHHYQQHHHQDQKNDDDNNNDLSIYIKDRAIVIAKFASELFYSVCLWKIALLALSNLTKLALYANQAQTHKYPQIHVLKQHILAHTRTHIHRILFPSVKASAWSRIARSFGIVENQALLVYKCEHKSEKEKDFVDAVYGSDMTDRQKRELCRR